MGDDDKRKFEPGATMQIDLDQVQLVDLEAAVARKAPPPLPPELPTSTVLRPSGTTSVRPPPAASASPRTKNFFYIGLIAVVVAVAIAAGLAVGRGVGGASTAAPSASAAPSSPPSAGVLTLPPIEVK